MSNYLDARNETYGLDIKIADSMANRAEILTAAGGTDISVQELINAFCDLLDGENLYDVRGKGFSNEQSLRIMEMKEKLGSLWTYADGTKIL
jgi:hypothetical protein